MISTSNTAGFAASHIMQQQPQSTTHQSGAQLYSSTIGNPLRQSSSNGSLPHIGQAAIQGICDQLAKGLQINTNQGIQSTGTGVPANKENNTKKLPSIGITGGSDQLGSSQQNISNQMVGGNSGIIGGHRASSGNGSSG